jgi:hypothetical protein
MGIDSKLQRIAGATAIAQGVVLALTAWLIMEPALWMASVLYAEDFDRMGSVPGWFWPWSLAIKYSVILEITLLSFGAALIILGRSTIKSAIPPYKSTSAAAAALIMCIFLVASLNSLYEASVLSSMSWAAGAPAFSKLEALHLANMISWLNVVVAILSVFCGVYSLKNITNKDRL